MKGLPPDIEEKEHYTPQEQAYNVAAAQLWIIGETIESAAKINPWEPPAPETPTTEQEAQDGRK